MKSKSKLNAQFVTSKIFDDLSSTAEPFAFKTDMLRKVAPTKANYPDARIYGTLNIQSSLIVA